MKLTPQGKLTRSWGYEVIWSSTEHYCGKMLIFDKAGATCPMMIHKVKRKSWFVNAGRFKMTYTNVTTGETQEAVIEEGKTIDIAEMSPHKLEALVANSIIFEVGMPDNMEDQFRLSPDADAVQSQTSKQE
jgi:mannose-6-phosphate isomerase-like protein (cupin superfamily)